MKHHELGSMLLIGGAAIVGLSMLYKLYTNYSTNVTSTSTDYINYLGTAGIVAGTALLWKKIE